MSDLVGTVHKHTEEIPEPEGWTCLEYDHDDHTWAVAFPGGLYATRDEAELDGAEDCQECGNRKCVRLVHIGHRPEVPMGALRNLLAMAEFYPGESGAKNIEAVTYWLSSLEEK